MIQLYNDDCKNIIPTLPDNSVDLVVTDPPYQFGNIHGSGMFSESNFEKYGRSRNIDFLHDLEKLDSVVFNPVEMLDMLKPKMKSFYGYFFCNKMLIADYINWARKQNYTYDVLVMAKSNPIPAHSTHHVSDLEYIILIRAKGTFFQGKGFDLDYYRKWFLTGCTKRIHPAEKPLELVKRLVNISSPRGGVILDCYMGSGTTGVACKELERDFVGIEIDKRYYEICERRINEASFNEKQLDLFVEAE